MKPDCRRWAPNAMENKMDEVEKAFREWFCGHYDHIVDETEWETFESELVSYRAATERAAEIPIPPVPAEHKQTKDFREGWTLAWHHYAAAIRGEK